MQNPGFTSCTALFAPPSLHIRRRPTSTSASGEVEFLAWLLINALRDDDMATGAEARRSVMSKAASATGVSARPSSSCSSPRTTGGRRSLRGRVARERLLVGQESRCHAGVECRIGDLLGAGRTKSGVPEARRLDVARVPPNAGLGTGGVPGLRSSGAHRHGRVRRKWLS